MIMLRLTHRLSPRAGALALIAASGVWLSACGDMRQAIGIDGGLCGSFDRSCLGNDAL